jgi:DNA cross-link repair 1C protein
MNCEATNNVNTVQIRPIITRTKVGAEIAEVGVGGGGGDLSQRPEVEFDSELMIDQFLGLSVWFFIFCVHI